MIVALESILDIYNGKAHCPNNTVNGANEQNGLRAIYLGYLKKVSLSPYKIYFDFNGKNA